MKTMKKLIAVIAALAAVGAAACAVAHLFKKKDESVCTFYDFNEEVEAELCPHV